MRVRNSNMNFVWSLTAIGWLLVGCDGETKTTEAWRGEVEKLFGPTKTQETDTRLNLQPSNNLFLISTSSLFLVSNDGTNCKQPDGTEGECVVYYQCDSETKKLITDGNTLIDIRFKDDRPCPQYLHVCCGRHQVNHTKPALPAGGRGACGYTNPGASDEGFRISATSEYAEFAEFRWMLAILKKNPENEAFTPKNYLGGASLIHPRMALTGAHKVDGYTPQELHLRAGEWDTRIEDETYSHQERDVQKIIVHEDFYRPSVLNSVALLMLVEPFELAPHVDVVCLAHALPPPDTPCYSMGWGKEDFGNSERYANVLKKVPLPIVSRAKCQSALRGTRLGSHFVLHSSFTCAGGKGGVDTCKGDGGSPLVCPITGQTGRFALVGTVAWGIGCGDNGVPGVYTDVTRFRDWVTTQVRENNLDTDTFEYTEP